MRSFLLLALCPVSDRFVSSFQARSSTPDSPPCPPRDAVQVWDGVVPSPEARDLLHRAASGSGAGHRAFTRPFPAGYRPSALERAMDGILGEIDGGGVEGGGERGRGISSLQYVEYWTRREWRHIEAHADVDENLAKAHDASAAAGEAVDVDDLTSEMSSTYPVTAAASRGDGGKTTTGYYRYPESGHVLYLRVGSDVRGPTCVFPGSGSGGDLARPIDGAGNDDGGSVELVTVPAVPGRLLRFPGDALHAVPRPHDLWLRSFVTGAPKFEPEETWGRSVILFNTWPGDEPPPRDVPLDDSDGMGAAVLEDDDGGDRSDGGEVDMYSSRSMWVEALAPDAESAAGTYDEDSRVECETARRLSEGDSPEEIQRRSLKTKVWLLGNMRRRGHMMRTVRLSAPEELRNALEEPTAASRLTLERG